VFFVISVVCFLLCRIRKKGFIHNVHVFYIMGAIILSIGCSIIFLIEGANALKKTLLLGKFSHLRLLIIPGYISLMIAFLGSIEIFIRRRLKF
jgi:hypothetical protein